MQDPAKKIDGSRISINLFFIVVSLGVIIPFILVLSISLTDEHSLLRQGYQLIPQKFSLLAYEVIFKSPEQLLQSYQITVLVTLIGTVLSLLLTSMFAFCISRRDYRYRRITTLYIFFTMLFSGGIVPLYILVAQYLDLKDTLLALIVPYLVNPFFILIMKGFMDKVPLEIVESAKMDGSSELRVFFTIILPLSKPALATVGLFISFAYWNDWYLGLLFIDNQKLLPLQLLLYRIMSNIEFLSNMSNNTAIRIKLSDFPNLSTRMAMAIMVAGPMMFIFPFFQKYFVSGLTVGSLKG